jgi:hypothetical protein
VPRWLWAIASAAPLPCSTTAPSPRQRYATFAEGTASLAWRSRLKVVFPPKFLRKDRLVPQTQRSERMSEAPLGLPAISSLPRKGDLLAERLQPVAGNIAPLIGRAFRAIETGREVVCLLNDAGQGILGRVVRERQPSRLAPLLGHVLRKEACAPAGVRPGTSMLLAPLFAPVPIGRPAAAHVELADVVEEGSQDDSFAFVHGCVSPPAIWCPILSIPNAVSCPSGEP